MPLEATLTAEEAAERGWTRTDSGWERRITQRDLAAVTAWERQEALRTQHPGIATASEAWRKRVAAVRPLLVDSVPRCAACTAA
jgi:hypothetical protein